MALLLAQPSFGKCRTRPTISESLKTHSYVFTGRVVLDFSNRERQQVMVYPLTWYKQSSPGQPLLVVHNNRPRFACATHFAVGRTYLFFSETPMAPWIHEVKACDATQAVDQLSPQDQSLLSALAK